jgi:outer membrane protein assembly factor BamB
MWLVMVILNKNTGRFLKLLAIFICVASLAACAGDLNVVTPTPTPTRPTVPYPAPPPTLYAGGYDGIVYALDISNGNVRWKFQTDAPITTSPAYSNGTVFIGGSDNKLYALNATTGELRWKIDTKARVATPFATPNTVFFGTDALYAADANTGKLIWVFRGSDLAYDPLFDNNTIYFVDNQRVLHAVDSGGKRELWEFQLKKIMIGRPTISKGVLYAASDDGQVYALSAKTGALLWSYDVGTIVRSPIAVTDTQVFLTSLNANVYAFDICPYTKNSEKLSGACTLKWKSSADSDTSEPLYAPPVAANGVVYVSSYDSFLYAIDAATGKKNWSFGTGNNIASAPVATKDKIYVASMSKRIFALETATGKKIWQFEGGDIFVSSPIVVAG